jgi:hypothetical protein
MTYNYGHACIQRVKNLRVSTLGIPTWAYVRNRRRIVAEDLSSPTGREYDFAAP